MTGSLRGGRRWEAGLASCCWEARGPQTTEGVGAELRHPHLGADGSGRACSDRAARTLGLCPRNRRLKDVFSDRNACSRRKAGKQSCVTDAGTVLCPSAPRDGAGRAILAAHTGAVLALRRCGEAGGLSAACCDPALRTFTWGWGRGASAHPPGAPTFSSHPRLSLFPLRQAPGLRRGPRCLRHPCQAGATATTVPGEARRSRKSRSCSSVHHAAQAASACWSRDAHRVLWPLTPGRLHAVRGRCLLGAGRWRSCWRAGQGAPTENPGPRLPVLRPVLVPPTADAAAEAPAHPHLHVPGAVPRVEQPGGSEPTPVAGPLGGRGNSELWAERPAQRFPPQVAMAATTNVATLTWHLPGSAMGSLAGGSGCPNSPSGGGAVLPGQGGSLPRPQLQAVLGPGPWARTADQRAPPRSREARGWAVPSPRPLVRRVRGAPGVPGWAPKPLSLCPALWATSSLTLQLHPWAWRGQPWGGGQGLQAKGRREASAQWETLLTRPQQCPHLGRQP